MHKVLIDDLLRLFFSIWMNIKQLNDSKNELMNHTFIADGKQNYQKKSIVLADNLYVVTVSANLP